MEDRGTLVHRGSEEPQDLKDVSETPETQLRVEIQSKF